MSSDCCLKNHYNHFYQEIFVDYHLSYNINFLCCDILFFGNLRNNKISVSAKLVEWNIKTNVLSYNQRNNYLNFYQVMTGTYQFHPSRIVIICDKTFYIFCKSFLTSSEERIYILYTIFYLEGIYLSKTCALYRSAVR